MKKYILIISLFFAFAMNSNAQSWKSMLGKVANKVTEEVASNEKVGDNILTNVLGNLIGQSVPFSKALIEGTWNYEGVACVLESENALSDIGGTVVTSQIEEKLDGYLAKLGIKESTCSFTFMENDSCSFTVNGRDIKGVYKLDEKEKKIDFSFLRGNLNMHSFLSYNVKDINIVFEADKLLELVKKVSSTVSDNTSALSGIASSSKLSGVGATLSTMSGLLENYDGMMLGMKLKK